ncbi:MAG: FMN-binding protein [Bacillota bacterium]
MNNVTKNIIKCIAVLTIIAAVSGALLGFVNEVTYVSDDELTARELEKFWPADSYEKIAEDDTASVYLATVGSETFYIATASGVGGYSGVVPMYVKITDGVIVEVQAGTNQETIKTPFGDSYISNFMNIDVNQVESFSFDGSNGSVQVDGITGATKSSSAIMDAINKCMEVYRSAEVD